MSPPRQPFTLRGRNLLAKVPTHAQAEVKAAFWQIFDDIDAAPGDQAVAQARQRAQLFADRYERRYPAAVTCLLDTLPELTTFLRFPREHWARIRPHQPDRADLRGDPPPGQGDRPAARRAQLPVAGVGGAGPGLTRLAGGRHDPGRCAPAAGVAPPAPPPSRPEEVTDPAVTVAA
jgi:Transposase, Mutator family